MAKRKAGQTIGAAAILVLGVLLAYLILTVGNERAGPPAGREAPPAEAMPPARRADGVSIATWNLYNFGRSKDAREMAAIAEVLRDFDVVAVQEVSTGPAGPQAVARLADELGRRGAAWDYVVSDPTSGDGSERYAYLWKPSRARLVGRPWLEPSLAEAIDREPFLARFEAGGRRVLLASFHAVPRAKNPGEEVARLSALQAHYPDDDLLVLGDFNLSQKDEAFDGLKRGGLSPVLVGQKTSIRMKAKESGLPDAHLANEYDNIFVEAPPLAVDTAGIVDFTTRFPTLEEARKISDHLPVFLGLAP